MIAGRGIAHSERSPDALRQSSHSVHGLQLWHGLPEAQEEVTASFHHHPVEDIPVTTQGGVQIRLLMGEAFGLKSPVQTFSQTLYAEYHLQAGQSAAVPQGVEELAGHLWEGDTCGGILFPREKSAFIRQWTTGG
jgi:hypothetical protein